MSYHLFERGFHPSEIFDLCVNGLQLLYGARPHIRTIRCRIRLEREKLMHFSQRETHMLGASDELKPFDHSR